MRPSTDQRRAARPGALHGAVIRGVDLVTQLTDTVAEARRTRRDPVLVAQRRRTAARRRLTAWSLVWLGLSAVLVAVLLDVIDGPVRPTNVAMVIFVGGLWIYSVLGGVQAALDLRIRSRLVSRLPPPQPARRAVTGAVRPLMARLDGYSDALRHEIGTLGAAPGAGPVLRELRNDTLAAADAAEQRLRRQAAELTAMTRGGSRPADPQLADARAQLQAEIGSGIDEYGRLVDAAADAAAASRRLAAAAADANNDMAQVTERLVTLTTGMRELMRTGP